MKRYPTVAFFVLTFLISWASWIPMVAISMGKWEVNNPDVWILNLWKWGGFAPFFAAVIVAYGASQMNGVQRLLGRFVKWKTGWKWYVVAFFLPALLSLLITLGHMMLGGDGPDFSQPKIYRYELIGFYQNYTAWTILIPMFLQNLLLGSPVGVTPIGEETGWRGFALPHLQGQYNALASSVILGLIWGLWQWPLYWNVDPDVGGSYGLIVLGVIPAAVLVTWIFNNTGGSLLLVLLYSNSLKMTDWFMPAAENVHPLVPIIIYWSVALFVVVFTGPARLSKRDLDDGCVEGASHQKIPVIQDLPRS